MIKKSYTTHDISEICGVYITTVINWIDSGRLPAYKTPGGHRRVKHEDLIKFLKDYNFPIPSELEIPLKHRILIIEDDPDTLEFLVTGLEAGTEYNIATAPSGKSGLKKLDEFQPQVLILDLKLPDIDGIELLKTVKERGSKTEVIIITAYPSIKNVVETMRLGSYDFLTKPLNIDEVRTCVVRCIEKIESFDEAQKLRGIDALYELSKTMGMTTDMQKLLDIITDLVYESLGADGVSIMLLDEKEKELEVKSAKGVSEDKLIGKKLKVGERIAGYVVQTTKPVLITGSVEKDKRFKGIKSYEKIKSAIIAPLIIRNKLIGVINVKRTEDEELYTEDDLKLLSIFAQDAAYVIEMSRIRNQLAKQINKIRQFVKEIRNLQGVS